MNKKMLIIILAVVVVGGGAGAYFMFLRPGPDTEKVAEAPQPGLVTMETFMVNIDDPQAARFAQLDLRLTVLPESLAATINEDEILRARLRDRVLTLLTSKSAQELSGPDGKEGLRREIKAHLSPLLEEGEIQDVLFSDFVIQ